MMRTSCSFYNQLQWQKLLCVFSHFSPIWLFAFLWTVARQAALSIEFSRQEHWSGPKPFSRGASQLRDQTQVSCTAGRFFTIWATKEALHFINFPLLSFFSGRVAQWALKKLFPEYRWRNKIHMVQRVDMTSLRFPFKPGLAPWLQGVCLAESTQLPLFQASPQWLSWSHVLLQWPLPMAISDSGMRA